MKLARILSSVYCQPWAVLPEVHQSIQNIITQKVQGNISDLILAEEVTPISARIGNVAIININGVVLPKVTSMDKQLGAVSCQDIRKAIKQAKASDAPYVILNIDSPGGVVQGIGELAEAIKDLAADKYVIAYSDGDMCSAAYWLAAQATSIVTSPSANVGSIGVFLAFLTYAEALQAQGVKPEIFQAGKYKTLGLTEKDVTDDERAFLEAGVNKTYADFLAAVSHRNLSEEVTQGQTFDGNTAFENKLVDAVESDLDEIIAYLNS